MTARLLTSEEAAALLKISERTLRKLRQAGEIPYIAIGTRLYRYAEEDCEAFIAARRCTDTPAPSRSTSNVRRTGNMTSSAGGGGFMARRAQLIADRRKR